MKGALCGFCQRIELGHAESPYLLLSLQRPSGRHVVESYGDWKKMQGWGSVAASAGSVGVVLMTRETPAPAMCALPAVAAQPEQDSVPEGMLCCTAVRADIVMLTYSWLW